MTWGDFTRLHRSQNPMNNVVKVIKNENFINNLDEKTYNQYLVDFENKNLDNNFVYNWLNNNGESLITSSIDFHYFYKEDVQFWLEYYKKNVQYFNHPISIITGRGNHASKHIKYDISSIILFKNDSTGILEDFVWRWLTQNQICFRKTPGKFIIL